MAMGLAATLEQAGGAVALSVHPAAAEEILHWSCGPVRTPETIHYRTLQEMEGGLFCPRIFGPPAQARRRRFGHITLPAPVVSPLWRFANPSPLENLLEMPCSTLEDILQGDAWVRPGDRSPQVIASARDHEPEPGFFTGGEAIEAMLKAVSSQRLPAGLKDCPTALVQRFVPVMPANLRPLVLLDNGNFATADVNDLYRSLVNRANRLVKLEQLNAPPVILRNERRQLQRSFDRLQANRLLPDRDAVFGESKPDRSLVDCLSLLAGRLIDGEKKRVEWCGRARSVASAAVQEKTVLVPSKMFAELRLDAEQPVLVTNLDQPSGDFVSLLPRAYQHAVLALPYGASSRLGLERAAAPVCIVHRPLGAEACAEARRLLAADPGPVCDVSEPSGWVDAVDIRGLIDELAQAALLGTRVVLKSPRGQLVGGPGKIEFAEDRDLVAPPRRVAEVVAPGEKPGPAEGSQANTPC
jgi:hypothetical protein